VLHATIENIDVVAGTREKLQFDMTQQLMLRTGGKLLRRWYNMKERSAEITSSARRRIEESRWLRQRTICVLKCCRAIESPFRRPTISRPVWRTREKTDSAEQAREGSEGMRSG
jgi:hypothetical protein